MFLDWSFDGVERDGTDDEDGHWSDFGFESEQPFAATRIFSDIRRFEQAGYNRDTMRASADHLLEIVDLNSTNAEDREIYVEMRLFDIFGSDRLIIGFRRRREDRAEADVIGAFTLRFSGLLEAVGRFSNEQRPSCLLADNGD